ncbi:MAG: hypothetical protein GX044_01630 [Firmicutes bacterium]|jgi:hypothetical protein|nr:hypothetical protein [Bacillota bacterium]
MQGESLEESYHINLVINILIRYPEIFTVMYNLESSSFNLSYMINKRLTRDKYMELARLLEENLEAYRFFKKKERHPIKLRKKSFSGFTQLEIILPGGSQLNGEIGLITSIMRDNFKGDLISEMRLGDDDLSEEEPVSWDELLELLLNRNPDSHAKKLFAFRDSGKVYVYDK